MKMSVLFVPVSKRARNFQLVEYNTSYLIPFQIIFNLSDPRKQQFMKITSCRIPFQISLISYRLECRMTHFKAPRTSLCLLSVRNLIGLSSLLWAIITALLDPFSLSTCLVQSTFHCYAHRPWNRKVINCYVLHANTL